MKSEEVIQARIDMLEAKIVELKAEGVWHGYLHYLEEEILTLKWVLTDE